MNNYNLKAGEIQIKQSKRGIEFHAWNHERQRKIHIGTLIGVVFEKGNVAILRKPEPSIALSQAEYGVAVDHGVQFLRCVTPEKATYSISLENFKKHAESYYNPAYGPQWRCSLSFFSRTNKAEKRNAILDNPPLPQGEGYERPQPAQLPLFVPNRSPLFDEYGNYRG
jgi:hypothetical protein